MKKELTDNGLSSVTGGTTYTVYNYQFSEETKIKDILKVYPWIGELYPDLKRAAALGFTVGKLMTMGNISATQLQSLLDRGAAMYNEDGTLK